ncbi:MAG: hypothetical protein KAH18_06680, partial [Psychromonas sp.]|nr:hypothetical protein [Psychromonas sp.]
MKQIKSILAIMFVGSIFSTTNLIATPITNGSQLIQPPVGSSVLDGVASGKQRKTFYTTTHKKIPAGREVGVYYASWGVYKGRDYAPHQVPVERISHVYVGFGGICGKNPAAFKSGAGLATSCASLVDGTQNGDYYLKNVKSSAKGEISFIDDNWAYFDKEYTNPDNSKYKGQLAGMIDWKNRNPNLKVIWSLGGWSYTRPFYKMTQKPEGRKKFIDSIVKWLDEPVMAFVDGVDIDWEFPGGSGADANVGDIKNDGENYVLLVKELRAALDKLGTKHERYYELTAALGVGLDKLDNFKASGATIKELLPYLDRLGLMTYDFHGAWSQKVGFNTALDRGAEDTSTLTIKKVIDKLVREHNITKADFSKISLGLGFYGRSHGDVAGTNQNNLIGSSSNGSGTGGTIEAGVFSYFDLYENYIGKNGKGINGWETLYYPEYAAALLWNPLKKQVISYTPPKGVEAIVQYAISKGMKGVFSWTVDDDNGVLLEAIHSGYGHTNQAVTPLEIKTVFAPVCTTYKGDIQPGMLFQDGGKIYEATKWHNKCPNQGTPREKAQWLDKSATYALLTHNPAGVTVTIPGETPPPNNGNGNGNG